MPLDSNGSWMFSPTEADLPSNAPLLAASMMPGPPPEITANPESDSRRASSIVRSYQKLPGRMRALPKIDTAGRTSASFSVASMNSEIIPSTCHDSRALIAVDRSVCVIARSWGTFFRIVMSEPTLLLVDGSSYLYRAFHALPDLRTRAGEPTGAIRGVVSMLRKLRADRKLAGDVRYAAVVFDAPGRTFRDDLYDRYKANRAETPADLRAQIAPIHEMVRAMGFPLLHVPGIEADDVIGTLTEQAWRMGLRTVVATGDKDLAQLVNPHVTLVDTMTRNGEAPQPLDRDGVIAKFGVPPERIVDYLALVGDAVDNVPGVAKVGPKTACKWLAEHGSLDGVIAAAGRIGGVVGENLRAALEWLPTARALVTIRTDCDLSAHLASIESSPVMRPEDPEALRLLLESADTLDAFAAGLAATIDWYRANEAWWAPQKDATEARYRAQGQ